jgi:hypothetical protein
MSEMRRWYGRETGPGLTQYKSGFFDLGPMHIPPIQPCVGMVDRAGTGQIWYLFWDGEDHLLLTDVLPASAQNVYVFQPYDGPYIGQTGWRLGVTTLTIDGGGFSGLEIGPSGDVLLADTSDGLGVIPGGSTPGGPPHLVVDVPGTFEGSRWPSSAHPLIAPPIAGQTLWSTPESTGWPTPQPPTVPGIPSSSPLPTGGGYAATEAAFATNTPVLVSSTYVAPSDNVPQPWHLGIWGGPSQS